MGNVQKVKVKKQTVTNGTPQLASFDIGNGFVKAKSAYEEATYASVIGDLNETLDGFSDITPDRDFVIGYNGKRVVVGEAVYRKGIGAAQMIRDVSRVGTPFYKTLFASALYATIPGNVNAPTTVEVVLSLPPKAYWDREKQKENLAGVYEIEVPDDQGGFCTVVYEVPYQLMRVIPEGVGTVCNIVLDDAGRERQNTDLHKKVVGVVDVGTLTTDLIMLDNLQLVRRGCDSILNALSDIYEKLISYAAQKGAVIEDYRCDSTVNDGYFLLQGKREPIDRRVESWSRDLASVIEGAIRTKWRGGNAVEDIVLRGGGAMNVYPYLQQAFPHVRLASDNKIDLVRSNADGGYRYGMLRRRETE